MEVDGVAVELAVLEEAPSRRQMRAVRKRSCGRGKRASGRGGVVLSLCVCVSARARGHAQSECVRARVCANWNGVGLCLRARRPAGVGESSGPLCGVIGVDREA